MSKSLALEKSSLLSYDDISESQHRLIDALYERDCLAICKKGFGKTVAALTAAQTLIDEGVLNRVLIIAPARVAENTWAGEGGKWEHLQDVMHIIGTHDERVELLSQDYPICVISRDLVPWLFEIYERTHRFEGLIIDEISKFKQAGSKGVRVLRKHSRDFLWRIGLSASPLAEAGVDIYAQMLLIDRGARLGRRVDEFRQRYFVPLDFNGYDWGYQYMGVERLATDLGDGIYMAEDEDYERQLPKLFEEIVPVRLGQDAASMYQEMAGSLIVEELGVEAANMAVRMGKLQQICQGAVYDDGGETHWIHRSKFNALTELLERPSIRDEPVLVSYNYVFEEQALREMDFRVFSDNPKQLQHDWNQGEISRLAIHPLSAGHGINLQGGGHTIIHTCPIWSADQWEQVLGRIRRRGQLSPFVTRYVLVCPNTVDELILDRLAGKADVEERMMEHLRAVST